MIDDNLIIAKAANTGPLMTKANVVGVGIGYKEIEGETTKEESVVVYVEKKVSIATLRPEDFIPTAVSGRRYRTDVVEIGKVKAQMYTSKERPAQPGISLGHFDITAGTFGAVVYGAAGEPYFLSNNHVVANTNDAGKGDRVLQPGPIDGGTDDDIVGYLERFIPINFGEKPPPPPPPNEKCGVAEFYVRLGNAAASLLGRKTRVETRPPSYAYAQEEWINYVDCGLVRPANPDIFIPQIKKIGDITEMEEATLGLAVQKTGRTTEHTVGTVRSIHATIRVSYGKDQTALFENQVVTDNMSQGGDSGSLVVTRLGEFKAVGLLFAGSAVSTILNPIDMVLTALDVSLTR